LVPADSLADSLFVVMTLSQSDTVITGTARYGGIGLQISGSYHPPHVDLDAMSGLIATSHKIIAFGLLGSATSATTLELSQDGAPPMRFAKQ
jgi:hypothetical protein